jgi:hypothetical protein
MTATDHPDRSRGAAAPIRGTEVHPGDTDERSDRRATEGRPAGSEADNRNNLSGTENCREFVYPSQGLTSRDVAANRGQGGRFVAADETQRFLAKVDTTGDGGCWLWTGGVDRDGYGRFQARRPGGRWGYVPAHRWAWEAEHGPIPLGLTLDHRCHTLDLDCPGGRSCRHRRCVRPDHLDAVTSAENRRRAHHHRRARKDHQS